MTLQQNMILKQCMIFRKEYTTQIVYPDRENIYQAFDLTPFEDIKVVILGQDPYHGPTSTWVSIFSSTQC